MWKLKPLHANTARMTITQVGMEAGVSHAQHHWAV